MKWLTNLFRNYQRIRRLEEENIDLKAKLIQSQENLNKTNSYWKKKVYMLKNPKPKV